MMIVAPAALSSRMSSMIDAPVALSRFPVGSRSLGLTDAFDVVIYSDELGREFRKPHSAPFERALRELGVPAARAVHIGDRPGKDVAGAVNAGMRAVRVHTGEYSTIADPADATPWRSFADVTAALRSIAACTSPAVGKA